MNETNDFNNPYYQNTGSVPVKKPASGLAVTALVLGIISVFTCFFMVNIVLGFIAIILAVVALVKKQGGTGVSITAIVLSLLSIAFTALIIYLISPLLAVLPDLYHDMNEIYKNYDAIIEEYDQTGKLPDYMDKYSEGEIGEFFDEYYDGFDSFFDENLRLEN